jgi:hypothetical protein
VAAIGHKRAYSPGKIELSERLETDQIPVSLIEFDESEKPLVFSLD